MNSTVFVSAGWLPAVADVLKLHVVELFHVLWGTTGNNIYLNITIGEMWLSFLKPIFHDIYYLFKTPQTKFM